MAAEILRAEILTVLIPESNLWNRFVCCGFKDHSVDVGLPTDRGRCLEYGNKQEIETSGVLCNLCIPRHSVRLGILNCKNGFPWTDAWEPQKQELQYRYVYWWNLTHGCSLTFWVIGRPGRLCVSFFLGINLIKGRYSYSAGQRPWLTSSFSTNWWLPGRQAKAILFGAQTTNHFACITWIAAKPSNGGSPQVVWSHGHFRLSAHERRETQISQEIISNGSMNRLIRSLVSANSQPYLN